MKSKTYVVKVVAMALSKKKKNATVQSRADVLHSLDATLDDPEFHDVFFLCSGRTFLCHKFILSARSPIFKAMIANGSGTIEHKRTLVEYCAPEVLETFLQLLYTGESKNADKYAIELFGLAEKYEVTTVRNFLLSRLRHILSISNSAQIAILAHVNNEKGLEDSAIKYMVKHLDKVMMTEGWGKIEYNHNKLMTNLLLEIIRKKQDHVNQLVKSQREQEDRHQQQVKELKEQKKAQQQQLERHQHLLKQQQIKHQLHMQASKQQQFELQQQLEQQHLEQQKKNIEKNRAEQLEQEKRIYVKALFIAFVFLFFAFFTSLFFNFLQKALN